jgi:hypothetical protein
LATAAAALSKLLYFFFPIFIGMVYFLLPLFLGFVVWIWYGFGVAYTVLGNTKI